MVEVLGGLLALVGLLLICAVPVLLSTRRRPVEHVVTTGWADGRPGLAIHPHHGHWLLQAAGWVIVAGLLGLGLGLWYLRSSLYAAAALLGAGLYFAYLGWARASGRAGDGTVTLTEQGIHQLWGGSEVVVPWDDVRGLVTTPKELIVETRHRVRERRVLPLLGGRRAVLRDDAVSVPYGFLPPLPYQEMIELYARSAAAREELGSDEPVDRGRRLLREALHRPVRPSGRLIPGISVRWVVELLLQLTGWAVLAIGGGSLFLLATTGSAPAIGTVPVAVAVTVAAAALIWLTRRSMYKRKYRGY